MKEWKSPFNSFNSWKGMLYAPWYQSIRDWKDFKEKAPIAPVEASLDPIHACNLMCEHCNAHKYLVEDNIDNYRMPDEHLYNLINFLGNWGVKAICFTGNTKVKLANGTHKTFEELTENWNKNQQSFEVYSRDKIGNIVPGIAHSPRKTRQVEKIIELTLDNGEKISCTLDHKFMLKNGSYKEAKDLEINDSLMPLYTKILSDGYEFIMDSSYQGTTHRLFSNYWDGNMNQMKSNELVVYHKNFNKRDNTRKNLQQMTPKNHGILHTPIGEHTFENAIDLVYNHKIIKKEIITLDKPIQMYCMTVDKFNNFALEAGVFVKNCFGGGGEPTLHTYLKKALELTSSLGMEASVATNGVLISKSLAETMVKTCRWIGISVDASTAGTYAIGRKKDCFIDTLNSISLLSHYSKKYKSNCDIAYKFLIFDYNQHEIYDACKIAKKIGAKDFHARPADMSHQGMGKFKNKAKSYDIDIVKKQFERCHELEDKNFHVYTIVHKFDDSFKPKKDFSQCYASPCCIQLCANGGVYLCPDQRHQEFYKLGDHYPLPSRILEFWGGKKHYDLVFNTGKDNCTTRCTFNPYCKQCEELFIKNTDPMCWKFI